MRALVLGSAAGGGFPQWNCNCSNCSRLREGSLRSASRTQSSVAVSSDGEKWALLNASPDVRMQMARHQELWPRVGVRATPVRGVVLVDAQLDHTMGLLTLREGGPLDVYATQAVCSHLDRVFPIFKVLDAFCGVHRHVVPTDGTSFTVDGIEELTMQAIPLGGRPPRYAAHGQDGDHTIALAITETATKQTLLYAPALASLDGPAAEALASSACALLDGTFWADDELIRQDCGAKLARDMGHLSLGGAGGLLERLRDFPRVRKVLVHINNTNPVLDDDSVERTLLAREGIEVAHDGMQLLL